MYTGPNIPKHFVLFCCNALLTRFQLSLCYKMLETGNVEIDFFLCIRTFSGRVAIGGFLDCYCYRQIERIWDDEQALLGLTLDMYAKTEYKKWLMPNMTHSVEDCLECL